MRTGVLTSLLAEYSKRYHLRLVGYCVLTNHVHLVAVPERDDSLAKVLGRTHCDYARWLHIRQRATGHLWQNRFFSCALDAGHCWAALRNVEQNPVRAAITQSPESWPWSSARAHFTGHDALGLLDLREWQTCWTPHLWKQALGSNTGDTMLEERIRQATRTGRPLGTEGFAAELERVLDRALQPAKRGRKPLARAASCSA
jgi:putative transposase